MKDLRNTCERKVLVQREAFDGIDMAAMHAPSPVVYSSLIGCTSCIVKCFRSRSSFISSPLWTP